MSSEFHHPWHALPETYYYAVEAPSLLSRLGGAPAASASASTTPQGGLSGGVLFGQKKPEAPTTTTTAASTSPFTLGGTKPTEGASTLGSSLLFMAESIFLYLDELLLSNISAAGSGLFGTAPANKDATTAPGKILVFFASALAAELPAIAAGGGLFGSAPASKDKPEEKKAAGEFCWRFYAVSDNGVDVRHSSITIYLIRS